MKKFEILATSIRGHRTLAGEKKPEKERTKENVESSGKYRPP